MIIRGNGMNLTTEERMLINSEIQAKGKNTLVAYILWFFLGSLGIHRFYHLVNSSRDFSREMNWLRLRHSLSYVSQPTYIKFNYCKNTFVYGI